MATPQNNTEKSETPPHNPKGETPPEGPPNSQSAKPEGDRTSPERVSVDELKALLSGGTVAVAFAFLALLNAYDCTLPIPFQFLDHDPLGIAPLFGILIDVVIAAFRFW